MSQIQIRSITAKDFEGFHACLDSVARERKFLGLVEASPLEKTRKWLMEGMERGEIRLIALDGSNVVGWCDIEISQNEGFTHAGRFGMGIHKDYRGLGLGSGLLKETLSVAKNKGLERVALDVFASNISAIKLYEKFNFQVEGCKRKARKIDGIYDDILAMAILFEQ
ncbi:MAG TPA: GNAT family N-acetyltransferase [Anaerolineales bacterium]|nr:GNAT family N-acetyltransferase [Anaerolineales bacterium]